MSTEDGYLYYGNCKRINSLNCEYCFQEVDAQHSLFKVYSKGKHNRMIMCFECLTNKDRRYKLSILKDGEYKDVGWTGANLDRKN